MTIIICSEEGRELGVIYGGVENTTCVFGESPVLYGGARRDARRKKMYVLCNIKVSGQ